MLTRKNNFQALTKMPRISEAEFLENLDEILARIDSEKVGFVITRDGTDDIVICPIDWFLDPLGDGYEDIVLAAVHHAINTPTSPQIPKYIQKNLFALTGQTSAELLEILDSYPNLGTAWVSLAENLRDYISAISKD